MPVLGNVDAHHNAGIRSMLYLGHSRSTLWYGSQNHHRDVSLSYSRLRIFQNCAGGHNLQRRFFPEMLRHRVHRQGHPEMGQRERRRMAPHRSGQAAAERQHRDIQWQPAQRMPERGDLRQPREARRKLALWRYDYITCKPHPSLGNKTPSEARHKLDLFDGNAPGELVQFDTDQYQTEELSL